MNHFLYDELEIPFKSVQGLYNINRVRRFYEHNDKFLYFVLASHRLLAVTDKGEEFVGFVEHPDDVDLPQVRI